MSLKKWVRRKIDRWRTAETPEAYWVARGNRIVGLGDLDAVKSSRQIETFRIIRDFLDQLQVSEVLDVGSNISVLGQLLADSRWSGRYLGLENNIHAIRHARGALKALGGSGELIQGNIRSLPLGDRAIDCLLMKDVLEHMEDFRPFLREALRVADRFLILGCFIPWHDGPTEFRRESRGFYLNRYCRREVIDFAADLGFKVLATETTEEADGNPNEVVVLARA